MNARQKNLVTLLAAALAAGGLGLYAYLGVLKPGEEETRGRETQEKLFAANPPGAQVTDGGATPALIFNQVSVETFHSKTVMELQNGVWRVTSPVSSKADKEQVNSLIHDLAAAKFKSTIEEHPTDADLERYGLKQPRATVTARAYVPDAQGGGAGDPARQRSVTFYLGADNIFDGSVYVRREGDPRVYSAEGAIRFSLMKDTNEWRDHLTFPVDEPSLLRITVKARKNTFTLERTTTERPWKLVSPVEMQAASDRVVRMVSDLRAREALTFPDERLEVEARKALDKPQVEATFLPRLGEPIRVRLAEVELNKLKQAFAFVTWGSESVLAQVDSATLNLLDVAPQEFKSRQVLDFSANEVRRILIHPATGGELIKLERAPDTERWEVVEPLPGKAQEFKVASLLGSLEKLHAEAVVESNPKSWSRYGIGEASRGVSVMDLAGQQLARLWIGNEVKGNPQRVWARGSTGDVFELDKSTLAALPQKLADFLDNPPPAPRSP